MKEAYIFLTSSTERFSQKALYGVILLFSNRAMHAIGLHGKSFIPLLLGFDCNVPAIYATRTLGNALTALLIPLMSCGAKLPVYVVFIGAFFPTYAGTVLWSLYVMGICWLMEATVTRFAYQMVSVWGLSALIYQGGKLLGLG